MLVYQRVGKNYGNSGTLAKTKETIRGKHPTATNTKEIRTSINWVCEHPTYHTT
jgi:hypothetical protein